MEWTSESLRTAPEANSEIKPILEWKEAFQEPTEEKEEEMRRPLEEHGDELQHMKGTRRRANLMTSLNSLTSKTMKLTPITGLYLI